MVEWQNKKMTHGRLRRQYWED